MGKRLTGSGGNNDINALAKRTVFIMIQEKTFQKDAAILPRRGGEYRNGLRVTSCINGKSTARPSEGPGAVISNMGCSVDDDGIMYLDTVHPGFTPEQVKENRSFDLNISR